MQNIKQTQITDELLSSLSNDERDAFLEATTSIPFVANMISDKRCYAKDRPRDEYGRIIVDITNPHILENMDYFRQTALHYIKYGCYTKLRPNSNPNSEYAKWLHTEIDRIWHGMVREEDGEWIPGSLYFYWNYCPILQSKIKKGSKKAERIISFPEPWDSTYLWAHYSEQAIRGGIYNDYKGGEHFGVIARRGIGKAHPYDEYIYTPKGIRKWGELKIGDDVFGDDGIPTKIIDIPFDGMVDTYKVTLRDGRSVLCSDEHLWNVEIHNQKGIKTLSTKQLIDIYKRNRKSTYRNPNGVEYICSIPKGGCVEFEKQNTLIDPYTFGLLLGDGTFRHTPFYLTMDNSDFNEIRYNIPYECCNQKSSNFNHRIEIQNLKNILINYGLYRKKSEDKFIPDEYKFNSKEVRLAILNGLIDTDGYVLRKHSAYYISTSSPKLADDIIMISRSLGFNASCSVKNTKYFNKKKNKYINCLPSYTITIYSDIKLGLLARKQSCELKGGYSRSRFEKTRIIDIKYVGKRMSKCITVNNESGCYLINDFVVTHNSLFIASMLARLFICGDNEEVNRSVKGTVVASDKTYLQKDGTLNKFVDFIDHCAVTTQFPAKRIKSSLDEMHWIMGYRDTDNDQIIRGTKNEVSGMSVKDNSGRIRGKRALLTVFEEFGSFPNFLETYNTALYNAEEGGYSFGTLAVIGTGGSKANDFSGALEMIYHPEGYHMYPLPNVFDKNSQGKSTSLLFLGAYLNRKGYYDDDGNSDVVGALVEVIKEREHIKRNSSDPSTVTQKKAEMPITIQECIMKTNTNIYPVADINERLNFLTLNPHELDGVKSGKFNLKGGEVSFELTNDEPIHNFPHKDNHIMGAVEMFKEPEINKVTNSVFNDRYIAGLDTYDNDIADSLSLGSIFVLDTFTDQIVCEYTGRPTYADEFYEIARRMCLYYNCKINYEAHPYDQIVMLPDGTKKMWKDINIGDTLFAPNGRTVKVIDIPVDGEDDIYEITFADGRKVQSSKNHIWSVYTVEKRNKLQEFTTLQMLENGVVNKFNQKRFFVPESGPINYNHKDIPIDPYTFGLLLAEGSFTKFNKKNNFYQSNRKRKSIQISSNNMDAEFYKTVIPYNMKYIGNKGYSWHLYIEDIDKKLDNLGLLFKYSNEKFIPNCYLFNDYNTRLELLKGLMDGDGCAINNSASVYVTTSMQLAENILLLCRSLGIKARLQKVIPCKTIRDCNGRICSHKKVYRISICSEIHIFKLPRKVEKQHIYSPSSKGSKAKGFLHKNAITNIKYIGRKRCKCVTIDNPNGLYLIGDYIVTHNCNKKGLYAYFSRMNSTYLLTDRFEYLSDKDLYKGSYYGNVTKGTTATAPVKAYARKLIRDWLLKPCTKIEKNGDEDIEVTYPNLENVKNIALLKELSMYNLDGNFDRHDALAMLMIYREDILRLCGGEVNKEEQINGLEKDSFFDTFKKKSPVNKHYRAILR